MAKNNRVKVRGIVKYSHTDQPYTWSDAKNKSLPDPDGKYDITIEVPIEKATAFLDAMDDFETPKTPKKLAWKVHEDDGIVVIKANQPGKDKDGKVRKLPHFDSKGKPLSSGFRLTRGSEVVIEVHPYYYKAQGGGVTLYLNWVQVAKYVEFDSGPGALEDGEFEGSNEDDVMVDDTADDELNEDAQEDNTDEAEDSTDF